MITTNKKVSDIMDTAGASLMEIYLDPLLIEMINPTYPRWRRYCVKIKYGKHPAHYIDMLYTEAPTIFGCIPRVKNIGVSAEWRVK